MNGRFMLNVQASNVTAQENEKSKPVRHDIMLFPWYVQIPVMCIIAIMAKWSYILMVTKYSYITALIKLLNRIRICTRFEFWLKDLKMVFMGVETIPCLWILLSNNR